MVALAADVSAAAEGGVQPIQRNSPPRSVSSATRALNFAEYRVHLPVIGSVLTGRTNLIHLSEIPGPAQRIARAG
jgi:hypothetical protein